MCTFADPKHFQVVFCRSSSRKEVFSCCCWSCSQSLDYICCLWPCFLSSLHAWWTNDRFNEIHIVEEDFKENGAFLRMDEVHQMNATSGMGEKHYMDGIDEISQ
jgi:hypothetical protein